MAKRVPNCSRCSEPHAVAAFCTTPAQYARSIALMDNNARRPTGDGWHSGLTEVDLLTLKDSHQRR